jgi:hypothetical protein
MITGKNLFVNIGLLNDHLYPQIRNRFDIKDHPVIIVYVYASIETEQVYLTSYVRLDNKDLLGSVDLTIQTVVRRLPNNLFHVIIC